MWVTPMSHLLPKVSAQLGELEDATSLPATSGATSEAQKLKAAGPVVKNMGISSPEMRRVEGGSPPGKRIL